MGDTNDKELTVLAETLHRLDDDGAIDIHAAKAYTGISRSTINRWINGDREPGFRHIKQFFLSQSPRVQLAILNVFSAGTNWTHTDLPTDLDINGDGQVDTDDALDALIISLDVVSDSLKQIRKSRNSKFTDVLTADLCERIDRLVTHAVAGKSVIQFLNLQNNSRRAARPLASRR